MTPPANAEKRDQLVPNWNSMGIPVTTPTAKLIPKIRIQKRAAASQTASAAPQRLPLEDHDEEREPHRELREEVVVGDGEGELQPVPEDGVGHGERILSGCGSSLSVRVGSDELPAGLPAPSSMRQRSVS